MNLKIDNKLALLVVLLTAAVDAMAQDGSPRRVMYMLSGGAVGGIVGFLLGLWWCRRCHDKKPHDKLDKPTHL
jgi:hypothetical protein